MLSIMTKTAPCIIATSSSCCFCVGCWTQDFLYWREFMCSVTALCVIRCRRSKRARVFNGPFSGTTVGSAARRYQSIAAQSAGLSAANAGSVMSAGIGCWTRDFLYWREFMCSVTALCVSRCRCSKRAHAFNGPFSGTTWVSRYQKGKTNLAFTEARDNEWQWHQLGHTQVCTSLQTTTQYPPHHSVFYRLDAIPAAQPTASKH